MDTDITYDEKFGINTFKHEIIGQLGEQAWTDMTFDCVIPDIDSESQCKCANMITFIERFENLVDKKTANKVLSKVRHGLKPSQCAWAREKFLEIGNLDEFIRQNYENEVLNFEKKLADNMDFYGDSITPEVLEFLKASPEILAGVRKDNKLYVAAFPAQMQLFLQEKDTKMKRYYACHCPFAKESILAEKTVSPTLCYCSLGHVKNFWEAVFDRELDGEVLTSALRGDVRCSYVIDIPDDVMETYV